MKKIFKNYTEWLENRNNNLSIGSSDIPAIIGVDKYKTPYDVWAIKMGLQEIKDNKFMFAGRHIEKAIASMFAESTGHEIVNGSEEFVVYYDDEYQFLSASPDREIILKYNTDEYPEDKYPAGTTGILECKNTSVDISDIPDYWYYQVQHQLSVTGYKFAFIACLIKGFEFKYFFVERNEKVIDFIRKEAIDFYNKYLITNTPPPNDEHGLEVDDNNIETINADDNLIELINKIKELSKESKTIEDELNILKDTLKEKMDKAQVVLYENKPIVTWKYTKPRKVFDEKKFQIENPELYSKYIINSKPFRRLIIK